MSGAEHGQSADHDPILDTCGEWNVPVIEDAAEALGATYNRAPTGRFGHFGVFSFNGNKIILPRQPGPRSRPHYEHSTIGYNYRMSTRRPRPRRLHSPSDLRISVPLGPSCR